MGRPCHRRRSDPARPIDRSPPEAPAPAPRRVGRLATRNAARRAGECRCADRDHAAPIDAGALMRRARWVAAPFALLQFVLYRPPAGVEVPFDQVVAGVVACAVLVAVNVVSLLMSRTTVGRSGAWSNAEFAADALAVWAIVALFSFDYVAAHWALLVIVVLEGAMRAGLRGAMVGWVASLAFYAPREYWAAYTFDRLPEPESITYRMGIVLIVALAAGTLARNLRATTAAAQAAQELARRKALLLAKVADAARHVSAVDANRVLEAALDCATEIGFDAAMFSMFDVDHGVWRVAECKGITLPENRRTAPIESGLAGRVHRQGARVVVDDYGAWAGGLEHIKALGFGQVAGVPISVGGELVAALIAGIRGDGHFGEAELECLELLASQAGAALGNTRMVERMWHQATHDALTGLPNQEMLADRAGQAVARATRNGTTVALLYLDVDRFKKVNDNLGHEEGNALLREIAGRLSGAMRASDTVARLGGDEFVILACDLPGPSAAGALADKMCRLFAEPFSLAGRRLYVTASVGVALYPDDALTFDDLRRLADLAMYQAKRRGRNTAERFTGGPGLVPTALDLESDLHRALERDELFLVYQPQVDLHTGDVVALEALVRWRHPRRGVLAPAAFLPIAEDGGLMEALDRCVLTQVCAQVRAWTDEHPHPRVAVNISGATMRNGAAYESITRIAREHGVDPSCLELEVTESVTMEEGEAGAGTLERLHEAGFHITVDDFGTGFSVLARLRQFPVDKLKVDKSFVQEVGVGAADAPLLRAIVSMADGLGLVVVAEGVETEEQEALVKGLGCDIAQGYLYGLPGPVPQFEVAPRAPLAGLPGAPA